MSDSYQLSASLSSFSAGMDSMEEKLVSIRKKIEGLKDEVSNHPNTITDTEGDPLAPDGQNYQDLQVYVERELFNILKLFEEN